MTYSICQKKAQLSIVFMEFSQTEHTHVISTQIKDQDTATLPRWPFKSPSCRSHYRPAPQGDEYPGS